VRLLALLAWLIGGIPEPMAGTPDTRAVPLRYTVDRWDVDDGLPNYALTDVVQSRDGYLWIATWAGIVRFDGARFTPVAEDLPNDHARAVIEDRHGAMWIGLSGTGVVRWHGRVVETLTEANGLAGRDVRALAEDGDGRIWAATENGVSMIEPRAFDGGSDGGSINRRSLDPSGSALTAGSSRVTTFRVEQGLPANAINRLARGRDGRMWIATPNGVCVADPLPRCTPVAFVRGRPTAVVQDRRGRVWVGSDAGLFSEGFDPSPLAGQPVNTLLPAAQGGLWVGFRDGGVALVDDRGVERYGASDGLPPGLVVALYEDPEGSVWIATTNGGLARLKPKRVQMYAMAQGLPSHQVGSVVQDATGTIWAGTQCGPVAELRGDRFVPRLTAEMPNACARILWPARDGALWIGTPDNGVFRWQHGRMTHIDAREGLSDTDITALFEDRDGVMWIGTQLGGVHTYTGGRLSRAFGPADGVATSIVASFAQDRDGRVWIGSNANGLSVYEGGRFRMLTPAESPPTRSISALLVDSRGDLWIGSATHGLFRRRGGRYEPFGLAQGLDDRMIAVIVEDRDSNLWVGTARGISRLERARIEAVAAGRASSLEPILLDRADGLRNPEGSGGGLDPSGLLDRQGRIWMPTIDGLAVIDPATFRINTVSPRVLIERVTVNDRPATAGAAGALEVPAGTESIELAYTAFSLLAPRKVRFRYRLHGLDSQWHDSGSRRAAYYTRLPPGSYRFEVLAANNDGVWSQRPVSVALTVRPFWWERWDVRGAALALLLVATGAVVRFVALRRTNARLAALERLHALERERTRIARDLHDDLGARLSLIGLMTEGTEASSVARAAAETLDHLVWTVNARNDTAGGFAAYATRFAEEHLDAAGLRHRFHIQESLGPHEINADARRQVFLAFKEAITNVIKHARATEVHITIGLQHDTLVVEVRDDGCGFIEGGGDPTGIGLEGMRERLAAVGGSATVGSAPGRGTRVVLRSPVQPRRDEPRISMRYGTPDAMGKTETP
jgi:ligand-binding sensor domain-containing protein/signal transduction histidine kinase